MSQTTSDATRVHLGRAIDHLQEAQADLQAAILDEPALSAVLRSVVLRLATDTQLVDAMHDATYAPTAPEGGVA